MTRALTLLVLAWLLPGCAHLPAWQRSTLQSRVMTEAFDPLELAFDGHVWATREHMAGADGGEGSSCGCN